MIVVGIVGGTGAGKTEVLRLLAAHGAATVAADDLNREALAAGQPALAAIREAFGDQFVAPDGQLRRRDLGALIFADEDARRRLEAIVHPVMLDLLRRRLDQWRAAGVEVAVVEAAVLAQMGALDLVDRMVLVTAPAEQRKVRLAQRDGLSAAQVAARMELQDRLGQTAPVADYVIRNEGSRAALAQQVEHFWAALV